MRLNWVVAGPVSAGMLVAALGTAGCATGAAAAIPPVTSTHAAARSTPASTGSVAARAGGSAAASSTAPAGSSGSSATGGGSGGNSGSAGPGGAAPATAAKPLAGKVVGIDPGHNGRNNTDPSFINKLIWNGREKETCDTTGTETNAGYTEARFNFNVATYLRADLRKLGARVVMSRASNNGVGPCVTTRTTILNRAHAAVAIDIHGDGGPASGRGFTVLEPIRDGPNNKVIQSSVRFGTIVHTAMLHYTRMPISNYYGRNGYIFRDDLAGLNLTTVPKILIETGNMRNARDAALLSAPWFQQRLAIAFTHAIQTFMTKH